jgi:hypothetical protein
LFCIIITILIYDLPFQPGLSTCCPKAKNIPLFFHKCPILVGKLERKRLLGRPKNRREYIIKMGLKVMEWKMFYWIYLAQDRCRWLVGVNSTLNLRVP